MASPTREEADALVSLEERILRAVELVNTLREEKQAAESRVQTILAERADTDKTIAELQTDNERLQEELESLRSERKQVRGRIEKLLGQLDTIGS